MIRAQHRLWADIVFQPYLTGLFKRNFHADSAIRNTTGNTVTICRCCTTAESQYMVGRILCLPAQQTGFPPHSLFDDVRGAAIKIQILCENRVLIRLNRSIDAMSSLNHLNIPWRLLKPKDVTRSSRFFRKGNSCRGIRVPSVTNAVLNGFYGNTGNLSLCCR